MYSLSHGQGLERIEARNWAEFQPDGALNRFGFVGFQENFMRVSFWDFLHCPLICSSKSSFKHRSPQTVGFEDAQVAVHVEEKLSDDERIEVGNGVGVVRRRSSLKKPSLDLDSEDSGKGGVKWMDFMGKDLVEIREFERNDSWDSDDEDDNNPTCICVIQ